MNDNWFCCSHSSYSHHPLWKALWEYLFDISSIFRPEMCTITMQHFSSSIYCNAGITDEDKLFYESILCKLSVSKADKNKNDYRKAETSLRNRSRLYVCVCVLLHMRVGVPGNERAGCSGRKRMKDWSVKLYFRWCWINVLDLQLNSEAVSHSLVTTGNLSMERYYLRTHTQLFIIIIYICRVIKKTMTKLNK